MTKKLSLSIRNYIYADIQNTKPKNIKNLSAYVEELIVLGLRVKKEALGR
jgi:hypothetical protein|tara:strand:- start:593 stop:742 length:150 start_codon:yes stop_codon:yes gene_type:complete